MKVGEAAEAAGVTPKAVRLWESKGLLPPAGRTAAGYRIFTDEDVQILRFIRQAKSLDLTLDEIGDVLDLQRDGAVTCGRVTALLDAHIERLDRTMTELRRLRTSLDRVRRTAREGQARGEEAMICRIIESVPLPEPATAG
ncbi:heavy metal-responsive transcriptional regulator [Arthrobacter sp. MMS18-M83]|uniref:heavy metal-responsive transcriptional regulator n=1 Tax=Arthrobacter sp. MMS18-M83 TaxID=2996261 RepID=UPI00227C0709|nr:heavy metal-responsive transcriptional regulator [Arthrobacter sp. MMS18-M83]WAH98175.1 heavy metal-responsive transcriptional regulator [Arthrobacter sp. MMS18-M83]